VHPQEVLTSEIIRSDLPTFVNLKGKDTVSPCTIFPKSCNSDSNLNEGNCERSPFPFAVFGFRITSDEILLLLQEEKEIVIIPAQKMRAKKCLFITGIPELGCKNKKNQGIKSGIQDYSYISLFVIDYFVNSSSFS